MPSPMLARPFPLVAGVATVTARRQVTPRMARFTLSAPAFADLGVERPGEILTLGWCDEGDELALPQTGWRFPDGRPEQHWRNFTVRAYRPEAAEVDVDFFLHGDVGRASAWAARAPPVETAADVDLRWVTRDGRPPGTTTAIADALAALELRDGPVQLWGGGEALAMRAVRETVRDAGAEIVAKDVIGYWKHRTTPDWDDVDDD